MKHIIRKKLIIILKKHNMNSSALPDLLGVRQDLVNLWLQAESLPEDKIRELETKIPLTQDEADFFIDRNREEKATQRIKYKKEGDTLVSKHPLISAKTNAVYKVVIDLSTRTFQIKNVCSRKIIKTGGAPGKKERVQQAAKRALEGLGVRFDIEVRQNG